MLYLYYFNAGDNIMKKIKIAYFKNKSKNMYINGGIIFCQDSRIVIKSLFITIVKFDTATFKWKTLQDDTMGYKTIEMSDNDNSYECKFFKKDFEIFQKEFIKFKV